MIAPSEEVVVPGVGVYKFVLDPRDRYIIVETVGAPLVKETTGVTVGFGRLLACSVHRNVDWCEDIQFLVSGNHDALLLWGTEGNEPDLTGALLSLPLVPTRDTWGDVSFGQPTSEGSYPVYYHATFIGSASEERPFIGFFSRGEGRSVLRGMLYNWYANFYEQLPKKYKECRATTHGYKAQMIWDKDMRSKSVEKTLPQTWSVFATSKCVTCASGDTMDDFDDVVPDDTKPPRF